MCKRKVKTQGLAVHLICNFRFILIRSIFLILLRWFKQEDEKREIFGEVSILYRNFSQKYLGKNVVCM
jgi:hypothetical protein